MYLDGHRQIHVMVEQVPVLYLTYFYMRQYLYFRDWKNAGFELNSELSDFYKDYRAERPEVGMWEQSWTLPEPTVDSYSEDLIKNAQDFSDTALVVITHV